MLWPTEQIQCVVSVGCGRAVLELELPELPSSTEISLGHVKKIMKFVDAASDTELTHLAMTDVFSPNVYYRLNPYMNEQYSLDVVDPVKLERMGHDTLHYIRRNKLKFELAADQLTKRPSWKTRLRRNGVSSDYLAYLARRTWPLSSFVDRIPIAKV
ncbi:Patatin-like phospholipase family protein [Aphelenchoides avenae]|nr:Patatin-like phospholipase family protein [Aphelenchus avenae]